MFNRLNKFLQTPSAQPTATVDASRFVLWVDGVGAYLLFLQQRVSIGGPAGSGDRADLSLLANLARRHATVVRSGEAYLLEAQGPARLNGHPAETRADLSHNYRIELGEGVRLQFRQPSPLSRTATLEFLSDHRPAQSVDGIVLMDDTCLLGPGTDNHIRCAHWDDSVLLFRREGEFRCKMPGELVINGRKATSPCAFAPGDVIGGPDGRFRLEALESV